MQSCFQFKDLNMLEHGKNVYTEYLKLIDQLDKGEVEPILQQIYPLIKPSLPPPKILKRYMVLHDCGKYLCTHIDEEGRNHFPNHAEHSAKQYSHLFPDDGLTTALIARDMDFHTARGEALTTIWKSPFAPILYLSAWASINANAMMFGGKDSESYKIKRSRLIQSGKKFLNMKGN